MEPVIAAFDLDGTLTTRETLMPFLVRARGTAAVVRAMGRRPGRAVGAATGWGDRDGLKAAVLSELLAGIDNEHLSELGRSHAATIEQRWLREDTVGRLRWHQGEGHTVVVVSASLRCYVEPLAARLGVENVLATDLEVGGDGRLTGRLLGANCRGPEKVTRLQHRFGRGTRARFAYGNSTGDRELLAAARHGVRVGRRAIPIVPAEVGA